jgi:hypothetical protein
MQEREEAPPFVDSRETGEQPKAKEGNRTSQIELQGDRGQSQ